MATLRYFEVLLSTLRYFQALLGVHKSLKTYGHFGVLLGTDPANFSIPLSPINFVVLACSTSSPKSLAVLLLSHSIVQLLHLPSFVSLFYLYHLIAIISELLLSSQPILFGFRELREMGSSLIESVTVSPPVTNLFCGEKGRCRAALLSRLKRGVNEGRGTTHI